MSDSKDCHSKIDLCVKDVLSTDEGRTLRETRFEYDGDGMLKNQYTTDFTTTANLAEPVAVRETQRNAYGIVVSETLFGEDGRAYCLPRKVLYEREKGGHVHRVTIFQENGGDVFFLGYYDLVPHRRGFPERVQHFSKGGDLLREQRYEYDDHGHLIRAYGRSGWTGVFTLERSREFQYDEHGGAIHFTHREPGKPTQQFLMNRYYDEQGLCTYAVFMEDPDSLEDKEKQVPGFFHDYEYRRFLIPSLK